MFSAWAFCDTNKSHAARRSGVGNPVFYVGAETGRDGLAGAAFASRDLTEESREDRPAVQVGDPFKEKLLLRSVPGIARDGRRRRHSGHGRGRFDLFHLRNREPRWHRRGDRSGQSSETRAGHDAVRNHAERIAGAHVDHREAGQGETSCAKFSRNGICRAPRSAR